MELDNRARAHKVRAYSVHPGSIGGTELGREAPLELFLKMGFVDANLTQQNHFHDELRQPYELLYNAVYLLFGH